MSRRRTAPRALAVAALVALGLCAAPAAAEELALIDDIVVDGERSEEPTAENLSVLVAATGQAQAATRGMGLAAGDEVRTGAGVQAVLRFLDLDPEVDPLVFIDEESAYRLVDSTTVEGFFGRLFASVAGLFSVITPGGRLAVEGTEFEVRIAPGGVLEVEVLEGVVALEPSAATLAPPAAEEPEEPAAPPEPDEPPAGPAIEIGVDFGERRDIPLELTLSNSCPETEGFFIDSPAELPWVKIVTEPRPVLVPANGNANTEALIRIDAAGVAPGLYRSSFTLRNEGRGDCIASSRSAPLAIKVAAAPEPPGEPGAPGNGQSGSAEPLRIAALEGVRLTAGDATAAPQKMAEEEVVEVLGWTDRVFVAVQPSYAADGDPPHFDSEEARSRAFRAARYDAVWKANPTARLKLGNVYKDWGEDRRASKAYRQAATADGSLNESADFVASWAEANRRAGRLAKAQEQAQRAVELDPGSGRALVALGNVYRGIAEQAGDSGDGEVETRYLERSVELFKAAGSGGADDAERRTRGVAETNLAETYAALARKDLARGDAAAAESRLAAARAAVEAADRSYSKSENPFLLLAEGQVEQVRARIAKALGDEAGSRRQLELAQRAYAEALEKHRDLAPAYYRLATVYEDRGETERAEEEYEKAVKTQPTYAPSYERLGRLKNAQSSGSGTDYLGRERKLAAPREILVLEQDSPRPTVDVEPAPPPVAVPDLVGESRDSALRLLQRSGLAGGRISLEPSCESAGRVLGQSPPQRTLLPPGTPVDLVIATPGPNARAVPELAGRSRREAERLLSRSGLRLGEVEERRSEQSEGTVLAQQPAPRTLLAPGCPVALSVATPPPLVSVPNFVGESLDKLQRTLNRIALSVAGVELGRVSYVDSRQYPEGTVVRQSPQAGSRVRRGSRVDLVVARRPPEPPPPTTVVVPNLVCLKPEQAAATLKELGLRHSLTGRGGEVLRQLPAAGDRVAAGSVVTLYLGYCPR